MASIRRGYAAQNKRLGILNPDEGGFLTDREQEEAKRAALLSRQDRGAHGEFDPASNKVRYNTTGQEGRNFLKSVDRFHGGDSWNKNLGGGSSFLQGPSSIGKDRILGMLPDSEALDDFATDKASEQGGGVDWEKLGSKQHDPFKTNYSHPDELGPDSEALEEAAMDKGSMLQELSDVNAVPQSAGDERFMKEFANKGKQHKAGLLDQYKKGFSDLKDKFTSPEEITGIQEITDPAFRNLDHATQSALDAEMAGKNEGDEEGRQMAQWKQLEGPSGPTGLPNNLLSTPEAKIDTEGESALDRIGRDNMLNERLGPDSLDGGESVDERSLWEKTKGLFSSDSDDEDEYKPLSKGKQAAVKLATSLLTSKDDPIRSAPVAGVKMGRVAFPNLLASSQRPVNPRYTPKGLG